MAFELRLTFSGLTALVPRKDIDEPGEAEEWLVVMPALQRGARLSKGKQKFFIPPHQAVLLVNAQAVKEKTKKARLRLRDPNVVASDDHSDFLFHLNREVLQIDLDEDEATKVEVHSKSPANELADKNVPELPDIADPNQLHDIKWVPPINKCYNQGVPFDGKHIDSKTLRPSAYLAAVVRLNRGRLETDRVHLGRVHEGDEEQPVPYAFRKGSFEGEIKLHQALANGFRLRVQIPEDTARLILKDHKGNPKRIVVGPYEGCPTEDGLRYVEVKIFNRELEDILGIAGDSVANDLDEPENPDAVNPLKGADTDFVIFYWFSPVWKELKAEDLVLPYLASGGGGGGGKPCEPPLFPGIKKG